jgi:site-specific DNA-methyltransferase (adenine-specific)
MVSACRWLQGDVFERMAELPDGSVDLIVTSPPFLALRTYLPAGHPDKHKEIGSEPTPAAFLSTLLALTREWRRILAPHGSIAVELGDTYSGSGGDTCGDNAGNDRYTVARDKPRRQSSGWPLPKSLCLIPSLYAGSLAYGHNLLNPDDTITPWRVRNLIVWHRPNPPVGALGDKVRPSTSYITTACTSSTRWFDLDAERTALSERRRADVSDVQSEPNKQRDGSRFNTLGPYDPSQSAGAPPLDCWIDSAAEDVWTIPTAPYKGAHYATYPIALPRRLINLMCPREVCTECGEPRRRKIYVESSTNDETQRDRTKGNGYGHPPGGHGQRSATTIGWTDCGCCDFAAHPLDGKCRPPYRRGVVLDPFAGSGTTLAAAAETGRDAIGIDLDERNLNLARDRLGLFLEEETA